jgi:hypothetical protein
MASRAYYQWREAGSVIVPARPIEEMTQRLRVAFPHGSFSWYANDAHYAATPPQDHTPYSADAWPVSPNPRWVVYALDVMATAVGGATTLDRLVTYWLAEARAGRMPWLKYLIWRARIYDVRFGWHAQDSDGHYDHAHLSARTDHTHTGLGAWSAVPTNTTTHGETMTPDQEALLLKQVSDINYILWRGGPENKTDFRSYFATITTSVQALGAQVAALTTTVEALGKAITAGGGTVDTAAILAGVDARLAEFRAQIEADTRDAVADAAEGGAAAVRADGP